MCVWVVTHGHVYGRTLAQRHMYGGTWVRVRGTQPQPHLPHPSPGVRPTEDSLRVTPYSTSLAALRSVHMSGSHSIVRHVLMSLPQGGHRCNLGILECTGTTLFRPGPAGAHSGRHPPYSEAPRPVRPRGRRRGNRPRATGGVGFSFGPRGPPRPRSPR